MITLSVNVFGHAAAAYDHPAAPEQCSEQARPNAVGLLAHEDVQSICNRHADSQRQDGDGVNIHTVILEVVHTGNSIAFIDHQDEDEPQDK